MVEYNEEKYHYLHNLQGDIVGIIDSNGTKVVEYKYDAWGKQVGDLYSDEEHLQLALTNPFWYRGYVFDTETNLYYLRNRYSVLFIPYNVEYDIDEGPNWGILYIPGIKGGILVHADSDFCD